MKHKIAKKLVGMIFLVTIIPLVVAGFIAYRQSTSTLKGMMLNRLDTLARERVNRLETLFTEREADIAMLAQVPAVANALEELSKSFIAGGMDAPAFQAVVSAQRPLLHLLIAKPDIYDFLMIGPSGDVLFTQSRERDLGTNLLNGRFKDSGLASVFRQASTGNRVVISDIDFYEPSRSPAVFLAVPVRKGERLAGVLAIQIPGQVLNHLAGDYAGLGLTGETSITAARGESVIWVAATRHDSGAAFNRKIQAGSKFAVPAQEAARGREGHGSHRDYRGIPVLAAWCYAPRLRLGMVIKMDEAEILAPVKALALWFILLGLGASAMAFASSLIFARSIARPIAALTLASKRMADGDLSARTGIHGSDEIGDLATHFNAMGAKLQGQTTALEERNWVREGLNRLGESMRGENDPVTLADKIVSCLALHVPAQVSALFLFEDGRLRLAGRFAYRKREGVPDEFALGEGLPGQAALERKTLQWADVPEDYILVGSALGQSAPRNIIVLPFFSAEELQGVVELAALEPFSGLQHEFLEQAMNGIGTALARSRANMRVRDMLEESQRLTEELRVQQEELHTVNEQLEEQTQQLKRSEELLRTQQEELQVSNEELEEKNDLLERQTREVEAARRDIETKAEELALASKYKSQFLANMSHELRTPLNSLLLLAQDLSRNKAGNLTPLQAESATIIYKSGSDLLNLINEILDLSKIEAGRMELQLGTVSVGDLANRVQSSFQHMAQDKNLRLEVTVSPDAPDRLTSDRKRIEQVIRNLVANAIKFTEQGGITVRFGRPDPGSDLSRSGLATNHCLAVAVSDTGIGIAPQQQKIIFEAFQQAESGTARKYGGTGLGLAISRELARILGGEIQLVSQAGQGATFTLYLPLDRAEADKKSPPPEAHPLREDGKTIQPQASPRPSRVDDDSSRITVADAIILIIEDDPEFTRILIDKCHGQNFKCLVASSGEAGIELALRHLPSAVLLDIRLPGIDGWAVLDTLKKDIRTRHIPVHVISVEDNATQALGKGAIGLTLKPASQEDLDQAIQQLDGIIREKPRRVLVVDDDEKMRRATIRMINGKDVEVDEAGTASEALAALRSRKYDCIVLDLGLPDMDGTSLLAKLKSENPALPPVIVHTAREISVEEAAKLRECAESIVIKDVRSQERLFDEVSLFLHRMVERMPEKKRKIIRDLHESDTLLKGKKVLVVDDDMRTAFAVSHILAERGMKPLKAENGQRALALLAEHPDVALVLMDIMMPVMDGYEAIRRIRAMKPHRSLPIIALTAKAMKEDREKCLAAGANDYMPKPLDAGRLVSMMRVWLYR